MGHEVKRPFRTGYGEKPDTPKPQPPKARVASGNMQKTVPAIVYKKAKPDGGEGGQHG